MVYEANILAMKFDRPVLGGHLRRRCVASPSNHPWTYRWTHPSGEVTTGSVLTLNGLRSEDFGTYTCVAEAPGNFRLVAYDVVRADGTSLTRGEGQIGSDRTSLLRGDGRTGLDRSQVANVRDAGSRRVSQGSNQGEIWRDAGFSFFEQEQ